MSRFHPNKFKLCPEPLPPEITLWCGICLGCDVKRFNNFYDRTCLDGDNWVSVKTVSTHYVCWTCYNNGDLSHMIFKHKESAAHFRSMWESKTVTDPDLDDIINVGFGCVSFGC